VQANQRRRTSARGTPFAATGAPLLRTRSPDATRAPGGPTVASSLACRRA
jgi:hypothetical protein